MAIRWYLSAFFLAAAASSVPAGQATAELPILLDPQGSVVVSATVRGVGPFRFMLDTGSTHSIVADELVRELALTPIARAELTTSTGQTMVAVVDIGFVSVGGTSAERLLASVVTKSALQVIGRDICGVLGQDFLSSHHFTIDYSHRRLRWDDLGEGLEPEVEMPMIRVPLLEQDGRFVMQVAQKNREEALLFVADTGSSEIVLFESDRLARLELVPAGTPQTALSSLTGSRPVRLMRLPSLAMGLLTLHDRLAVVMPPASREYSTVDGLLPLHMFRRVSFRQRDGYLLIGQ